MENLRDAALFAASKFASEPHVGGSATLLLAQLMPSGIVRAMNVGDSVLAIFRPAMRTLSRSPRPILWPRLLHRSYEATHYFNCPYQVSASTLVDEVSVNSDEVQVNVRPGDILLAMTDGVTDNVYDSHIQVHGFSYHFFPT